MPSSGPNNGAAGTTAISGTIDWSNPTNALTSNNSRATAALCAAEVSYALIVSDFGFSIPADATILGIVVEIERSASVTGSAIVRDHSVFLLKNGIDPSSNKGDGGTDWPDTGSESYATYGSSTDLWGLSLAFGDVNDSDFAAMIVAQNAGMDTGTAQVDHIRMTVYYSTPGDELVSYCRSSISMP